MSKPVKKLFYIYSIHLDYESRKTAYILYHTKRYYWGLPFEDYLMYYIDKDCYDFEFYSNDSDHFTNINDRFYFMPSTKKLTKEELIEKFKEYTKERIEKKTQQLQETCDMVVGMLDSLEEVK